MPATLTQKPSLPKHRAATPLCHVLRDTVTGRFYDGTDFTAAKVEHAHPLMDFQTRSLPLIGKQCEAIPVYASTR